LINRILDRILRWLADYYENIVIMSFGILFAIGLAIAWNWNQSNYVTQAQLDKVTWQLKQSEQRIDHLFDITRRLGD
jgi:predicted negative regulator of RcsB-dependent stress response